MSVPPHHGLDLPTLVIPTCQGTGSALQSWPGGHTILALVSHLLLDDSVTTPHSHDLAAGAKVVVVVAVVVVVVVVVEVVVNVVVVVANHSATQWTRGINDRTLL